MSIDKFRERNVWGGESSRIRRHRHKLQGRISSFSKRFISPSLSGAPSSCRTVAKGRADILKWSTFSFALQLELITELLGTPTLEDMRFACEGARSHMLRRAPKPPSLTALYTLSSQATHEAVHLLCQMLVFDPVSFLLPFLFSRPSRHILLFFLLSSFLKRELGGKLQASIFFSFSFFLDRRE